MYAIGGSWTVEKKKSGFVSEQNMICQGISYLRSSFFGGLVFLKAAAFIICGANDVLNVSYSERGAVEHRASRLGLLFGSVGVGCFIGPLFSDKYNDMNNPKVIQSICLVGFAVMTVGCIMMGTATQFSMVLFSSAFRSMGCSVVWINSSLLLQKFCAPDMLGRIASIDYSAALLSEGVSAVMAGLLQDHYGFSAEDVSLLQGLACAILLIAWSSYHFNGGGASAYEADKDDSSTVSSTDIESDQQETTSSLMAPLYIDRETG
jgi:MFS family permease